MVQEPSVTIPTALAIARVLPLALMESVKSITGQATVDPSTEAGL
jgi:hypothetical protein